MSSAALAQGKLEREIAFVRALAKDMRFIELAKEETDRLATTFRGAGDQDKIAQLAVEVSYYGARSRNDRSQQRALFKEAIDKSKELIDRSTDGGVQLEARSTLANASQDFGQFLTEELEIAREEAPERVKELEDEAVLVFRAGIEACTKVMESLQPLRSKDPQKDTEYSVMWMKKGVLQREQARAVKTDRLVLAARAVDELTEMVLETGEETAIGLRGLFEIAQCREVEGRVDAAVDAYKTTIGQIATSLTDANDGKLDMTGELQAFLFDMMQEVYVRAGELMVKQGAAGTDQLFAEFRANMTKFGDKSLDLFDVVSNTHGHLMLLAESRFLAESGDPKNVEKALAMTQRINDKHPTDYVGVKAKAVLRDILNLQSSLVSGALLFEVAKGELQNKNYEESIKGMRRAISVMTPAELKATGLEAYLMLGTSYGITDRYLEAIFAFTHGLEQLGANDKDKASDLADALDRAISNHKRQTKSDPFFDSLYGASSKWIAEYSVSGGSKLFWKAANEAFNDKKYADAVTQYTKVLPDFLFYEQARVRIGMAQQTAGDYPAARKTLQDYRKWVAANAIDSRDTGRLQIRGLAIADAEFTEVQMAYNEARGSDEPKLAKDLTKYPVAIEKARAFVTNFAQDGERNVPSALDYLGRLHTDIGDLDRAGEVYTQLKQKDAVRASRLATETFQEYENQVKHLASELDQAIASDKGDAAINKAKTELTAMRKKLVALGMDYIKSSPKPQLAVLVSTMTQFERLQEWERVDEVAKKTLEVYGNEERVKQTVDLIVRPKIGEALLKQRKFQQAYDMLVAAEQANPTQWELKRQISQALGGWFEFSRTGAPVREPGLDKPVEAYLKYYTEYRPWGERPEVSQYSLDWYRFQWEAFWYAKQAGLKDSKYKDIADKFYRIARSSDNFAKLKSFGVDGEELYNYFQSNR
ncbi:MAG: hypothetical protein ABIP94_10630 [Planctomycetota bacterium]